MPWLRFFDSEKAVSFASTAVGEFCKIRALVDSNKKHAGRKETLTIALVRKISSFARSEKLNFYTRAKMLTEIKRGLKSAGIEDAEVDAFIRAIALEALRSNKQT